MREIKFRAWNKSKKIMYPEASQWVNRCFIDAFKKNHSTEKQIPIEEVKLMQYTGLKDKNGKDIYEEDIVKWKDKIWKLLPIETEGIEFECVKGKYKGVIGSLRTSWVRHYPYKNVLLIRTGIEVIGNIYENPKLLLDLK